MDTYTVIGAKSFLGHAPGETFDADSEDPRTVRAVARGSIAAGKVEKKEKPLEDYSRDELNAQADGLGIGEPELLPNKAAVVSAIRSYDKE